MKYKYTHLAAFIVIMAMVTAVHGATTITTDGFNTGSIVSDPWGTTSSQTVGQWSLSQVASGAGRLVVGDPIGYGGQPGAPQAGTGQAQFSNGADSNFTSATLTDTTGHNFLVGEEVTMSFYMAGRAGGSAAATINVSLVGAATIPLGSFTPTHNDTTWVLTTSNTATISTAGTYNVRFSYANAPDSVDRTTYLDSVSYNVVPEPSTALLGGLGLLALMRRRR